MRRLSHSIVASVIGPTLAGLSHIITIPDTSPRGQLLTRILVDVMAEASGMVMMCESPAKVGPITDATVEWLNRLTN